MYEYELTNLLREVSAINKKYEGIAEATGENFNIFRILKMETREVTTHSAFHAELLNPKGSHGQGDIFLKLFLNQQREKQKNHPEFLRLFEKFDTSKCKVYKEKHIGFKNIDETEGGRIDILLSDAKNNVIVIENKIYGVEQPNWLVRYYNACPAAAIFYLTLNAVPPDNNNKGELSEGKHFVNISYKKDILEWMQVCQKEAKNHPLLGGTIAQYINLIKHLTNQTMNELTTEEIVNTIVKNPENIQAAQDISTGTVWTDVRLKIIQNMLKSITQIANSLRIEVIVDEGYILGKQYSGFSLLKKNGNIVYIFISQMTLKHCLLA